MGYPFIRALVVGLLSVCLCCMKGCRSDVPTVNYPPSSDRIIFDDVSSDGDQIGSCGRPVLENGDVEDSNSSFTVGKKVLLSCHQGFRFQHLKSQVIIVVCQADGTWKDGVEMKEMPTCERIGGCSLPPSIKNGYVGSKVSGYMPGDVAPVNCYNSFSLFPRDAKPFLICLNDGQWGPVDGLVELMCKVVEDCPWPTSVANGFVQVLSPDDTIIRSDHAKPGSRAIYHCAFGFLLTNGSVMLTCTDGTWQGDLPQCRLKQTTDRCSHLPVVSHAQPYLEDGSVLENAEMTFAHGSRIVYVCAYGYIQQGSSLVTCVTGEWIGQGPKCLLEERYCNLPPPQLDHGDYSLHGKEAYVNGKFPLGLRAFYFCNNGYRLKDVDFAVLTCMDGIWNGNLTSCIQRTKCDPPMDIENGNWILESVYADFRIGVVVSYECDDGYKAVGATKITCQALGYWSDYGPRCLPLDLYCTEPEPSANGFFMCKPSNCDFFRVGTEVHHVCSKNFEPQPSTALIQTCLPGGRWSGEKPLCMPVNFSVFSTTNAYSLDTNSITVVISTACAVPGLMISIMAIVFIKRRRKPRRRLCPPTPGPPSHLDYSSNHLNDQDHEALIPYIDFSPTVAPVLPTYEESMSSRTSPSRSPAAISWASSTRPSRHEFRSLPGSRTMGAVTPFIRDQASLEASQHRNSITTMASSMMRVENGSVAFGSIETVNVSDATSTSVTVDTCDSVASNPSIATSHCAAAGSIDSSFANELPSSDEGSHMMDRRIHESGGASTDGITSHHPADRFPCDDANCSQSESTPILEVPEDGMDE